MALQLAIYGRAAELLRLKDGLKLVGENNLLGLLAVLLSYSD